MKYEYKLESVLIATPDALENELNYHGADGWIYCGVHAEYIEPDYYERSENPDAVGYTKTYLIFRREIYTGDSIPDCPS